MIRQRAFRTAIIFSLRLSRAQCAARTNEYEPRPGMHKSRTPDYIILLSGSIHLVLDKDEVELQPFDAVVQRGTNHSWLNRGTQDALLMAVLIDDGVSGKAKFQRGS